MELEQILSNAAKHMSKEGQQRINNSTRNINRNQLINEDYCDSMNYTTQFPQQQTMEYRQPKQTQSKLPREIVESMLKTPINDYTNEFNTNTSVLDSLNIPKQTQNVNIIQEQIHTPQQQYVQQPVAQYQQQPLMVGIDYNYLKNIINECIKENMKQIKEELLNESSLKLIRLSGENKIQLVDNKNNLYESKLEYKKNITKK